MSNLSDYHNLIGLNVKANCSAGRLRRGTLREPSVLCSFTPPTECAMLHQSRAWCVASRSDLGVLAYDLAERVWCCCNGFDLGDYLLLNDATGPDGAQEYALVKKPAQPTSPYRQLDSITFGWTTTTKARQLLTEILTGGFDDESWAFDLPLSFAGQLETPSTHGRCRHCA